MGALGRQVDSRGGDIPVSLFPPSHQQMAFMTQQPFFAPEAAAIADQVAVTADDAMTGSNDRDWVLSIGRTNGTDGFGITQPIGNRLVRGGLAVGYGEQRCPDPLLKGCAVKGER